MTATPDQVIAQLTELRHDFEKIARIINDNLWHQQEKILDAKAIAIQAGEKMRETITSCAAAEAEREALLKALEGMRPHIEKLSRCIRVNDEMGRVVTGQTEAIVAIAEIHACTLSGDKS